jgi:hypothetical protein
MWNRPVVELLLELLVGLLLALALVRLVRQASWRVYCSVMEGVSGVCRTQTLLRLLRGLHYCIYLRSKERRMRDYKVFRAESKNSSGSSRSASLCRRVLVVVTAA